MAVYDDLAWFESNRQWIASTYNGGWVVIKDKAVVGGYPDYASAVQAANAMFGPENAVIKQALTVERVEYVNALGRRRLAQGVPFRAPMQNFAEELRRSGAIVDVVISAPKSYRSAGKPQTVKGMVDTGASISTVKDAVAAAAGLMQTGSVPLGGVGGTSERPIYAASFGLPQYGVTLDPIEIGGVDLPIPGIDILVGRDVLQKLRLDYHGVQGNFLLTTDASGQQVDSSGSIVSGTPEAGGSSWLIPVAAGAAVVGIGALFALDIL